MRRHRVQNDRPGRDAGIGANLDIAENLGACADHHAAPHLRVPIARGLARAPERHAVQDRHLVFHLGRLADDEAGGVIEEDALAEARRGMNIGRESVRRPTLDIESEVALAPAPQGVRQPRRLYRVIALEIEQGLDEPAAGGVALYIGGGVGAKGFAQRGLALERCEKSVGDGGGVHRRSPESPAHTMDHRFFETAPVQEFADEKRGERRVEGERALGLLSHMRPHGVAPCAKRGELLPGAFAEHQNFTCGACCAASLAVNSAMGAVPEKKVLAQSRVGNVRSEVLNSRTASM